MSIDIKCPECFTLFGKQQDDGTLSIKHRDLFRNIKGVVSGPCRRCGYIITWSNSEDQGTRQASLPNSTNAD